MGNILRCFEGGDDHAGGDHYLYHSPTSRPSYQPPPYPYYRHDQPSAAPPRPHQQALGHHGIRAAAAGVAGLDQNNINFKSKSMTAGSNTGNLQRGKEVCSNGVLAPRCRCKSQDIDESSAEELYDAVSYAKANAMLIQVPVLGTTKRFWRLSDKATRISRKLALILKSHHSIRKYLAAPLQVSNVWISSTGSVKLRGVSFTGEHFGIERVRDDYKHLSVVLLGLIRISGAEIIKLPPDYKEFLMLLRRDTLATKDEFLIVNNTALLPMKNRTEVFLMLHDKIIKYLGRTRAGQAKKKKIISKLPYEKDWLDTATANTQISQWVVNVQNQYERTQYDLLRLNRNVRSHMHDYNDDDIEEILYCEWPELLMDMAKMLHEEGELEGTDIQNKFG